MRSESTCRGGTGPDSPEYLRELQQVLPAIQLQALCSVSELGVVVIPVLPSTKGLILFSFSEGGTGPSLRGLADVPSPVQKA